MKIHEVFVHAKITVEDGGGGSEILSYMYINGYVTQINIILFMNKNL